MSTSNVTLEIAGRRYTVACAPGEERHIEELGRSISQKLSRQESLKAQSAERILLYAALLLADELHEVDKAKSAPSPQDGQAEALEKMAERLELVADRLETKADSA